MSRLLKIEFPTDRQPERIDRFVANSFPDYSRSHIKQLITINSVLCNNVTVKPSHKVAPGDIVTVTIPEAVPLEIVPENIPLEIFYQDDDIAVIQKPADLIVHPSGPIRSGTLVNALLYHLDNLSGINGVSRPGIVHRLDKDTSGVMVVAKNNRSHRSLGDQFAERTIEKHYTVLVWGVLSSNTGVISKLISRSRSDRKKMVSGAEGKESVTHYTVRDEFEYLTLLDVMPKTGRTHQIRSHFASVGNPVFGDSLYRGRNRQLSHLTSNERSVAQELLSQFPRQALHAATLSFMHPTSKKIMQFEAPLPDDMAKILEKMSTFRKNQVQ